MYTSIKNFQESLDGNVLNITSYTTDLVHLALTRKSEDFRATNNGLDFSAPTKLSSVPSTPNHITIRASVATLLVNPTATAETTNPFKAHEAIRAYTEHKR